MKRMMRCGRFSVWTLLAGFLLARTAFPAESLAIQSGAATTTATTTGAAINRHQTGPNLETFTIDLALPPEQRWEEVMAQRMEQFHHTMDWVIDHVIPRDVLPKVTAALDLLRDFWPKEEYRDEIQGIAKATGRDAGLVLLLNLVYELSAGCTSIVAQSSDGTVWHGRNLDFDIPNLQELAVNVEFVKDDQLIYEGTTYAGYIGILTGVKPRAFSLSQDQRETHTPIWENLVEFLITKGEAAAYPFLYRDLFETVDTYREALKVLQETPTLAPAYAILAGTKLGEGAVVTRDRNRAVDTWELNSPDGLWFLVETNDDHWKPPTDDRRDATIHNMNNYNPDNIDEHNLMRVLNQHPTLDKLTTYSTVMNAGYGYYRSVLQNVNDTNGEKEEEREKTTRDWNHGDNHWSGMQSKAEERDPPIVSMMGEQLLGSKTAMDRH